MRIFVCAKSLQPLILISLKLRFALLRKACYPEIANTNARFPLHFLINGKSYCPARVDILRRNLTKTLVLLLPPVDISSVLTMGELIYGFHNIKKS
jgi:hypothetical protein